MSNAMTRLAATYRARVVKTLQNPRIRAQLQVVLTSPEAQTLIALVRSSLAGVPDTAVPKTGVPDTGVPGTAGQDSSPHEVEQPPAPSQDAPSNEITQDWSLPPTQVMDRSTIEAAIQPQTQATRARAAAAVAGPVADAAPVLPALTAAGFTFAASTRDGCAGRCCARP